MNNSRRDDASRVIHRDGELADVGRPAEAPKRRSKWLMGAGIGAALLIGLLAIAAWQLGLFTDEPAEANLADAVALETSADAPEDDEATSMDDEPESSTADNGGQETSAAEPTAAPPMPTEAAEAAPEATKQPLTDTDTASDDPQPATGPIATSADLAGRWQIKPSDATYLGYRIDEILGGVDFTAVGRTAGVEGYLDADEGSIFEVEVVGDLVGLTSDSRARDGQLKTQALETNKFPEATFILTKSIPLTDLPTDGAALDFNAIGDLTVHGVTQPVDIPIQATVVDEQLFVVGSIDLALADFDISTPTAPAVASVSDIATMELSLVFTR